jgi:hypothetical protein
MKNIAAKLLFALALVLTVSATARADRIPQTSNDVPFYARFERGLIHTDGEWAAIAFYRPPACIRSDFNLLDFFDAPAAFGCNASEPYLIGFGIFQGGPFDPPIQSRLQSNPGQIMPVWFVSWSELSAAIADDALTIGELEALPSLEKGGATFYTETLHPFQAAKQTMTSIVAMGFLEDGRAFNYRATETHGTLRNVEISFN